MCKSLKQLENEEKLVDIGEKVKKKVKK